MAASDYTIKKDGPLCAVAQLVGTLAHLSETMTVTAFQPTSANDVFIGMAVLIDDEILRVVDNADFPVIEIARGCADTVPQQHSPGATVWFFDDAVVSDDKEYTATDTIAVKGLVFTGLGGAVPIEEAPPLEVTFDWRAQRPYPPGLFRIDGEPWFDSVKVPGPGDSLGFTYTHRDRILQADQLIDHSNGTIGPEPGTTYVAKVYTPGGTLVNIYSGITGEVWSYAELDAQADLPDGEGYIDFYSSRDGLESMQFYRTQVAWGGGGGVGPVMMVAICGPTGTSGGLGINWVTYMAQINAAGEMVAQASIAHHPDYRTRSIFPYAGSMYAVLIPRTGSAATYTKGYRTLIDGLAAELTLSVQIWAAAMAGDAKLIGISYASDGSGPAGALKDYFVLDATDDFSLASSGAITTDGSYWQCIAAEGSDFIVGGYNNDGYAAIRIHNHVTDTFVRTAVIGAPYYSIIHAVAMSVSYFAVLFDGDSPTLQIFDRATGTLLHTETFSEVNARKGLMMTDSRVVVSRTAGNITIGADMQVEVYEWVETPTPSLTLVDTPASPFSGALPNNDATVFNVAEPSGGVG